MDEAGDDGPKVVRAGRRARQAHLMQSEQVVEHSHDDQHPQNDIPFNSQDEQGPRAATLPAADEEDDHAPMPRSNQDEEGTAAPAAPPVKRQGFTDAAPTPPIDPLADDTGKKLAGVSRRKQEQQVHEEEELAKAKNKYEEKASVAPIMDIPELEEEGKEDLTRVVANAPKVRANRIQGMEELDEEQQYRLPASQDQDIDLSILTAVLCSSEMVDEPDDVWDPELLLSQVAAELNAAKDTGLEPKESMPDPMAF